MKEFSLPVVGAHPSAIALNAAQRDYELKNLHYNILPSYYRKPSENALQVMKEYYNAVYDTTVPANGGFTADALFFILHEGPCQEVAYGFACRDSHYLGRGGAEIILQILLVLENQRN